MASPEACDQDRLCYRNSIWHSTEDYRHGTSTLNPRRDRTPKKNLSQLILHFRNQSKPDKTPQNPNCHLKFKRQSPEP